MSNQLRSWLVVSKTGASTIISAYTESDAFEQATRWCGSDLLDTMEEQ